MKNKLTGDKPIRIGWLATSRYLQRRWALLSLFGFYRWYEGLAPSTPMRVSNVAEWMNANTPDIKSELYNPACHYDVVIIVKGTSAEFQQVARRVKQYGSKLVYDANVNYWEIWGEYDSASPKPTCAQQQGALALTEQADLVVADSSYLAEVAKKYNPNVCWIPDNVNLSIYSKVREHQAQSKLRVIWSGMSLKADHLGVILPALQEMGDWAELTLVSDHRPSVMGQLARNLATHFVPFSDRRYAATLAQCDVIISPKRLLNAYDLGHTEYKITLGMAAGLPAIASPQPSYIEAISYRQGGIIARSVDDWLAAFRKLHLDIDLRRKMGAAARATVQEKYATPAVAGQYANMIRRIMAR